MFQLIDSKSDFIEEIIIETKLFCNVSPSSKSEKPIWGEIVKSLNGKKLSKENRLSSAP